MSAIPRVYKSSKMIGALQELLKGKGLVSRDEDGSNFNQYFSKMRNKYYIELDEVRKPNINNNQTHLLRKLIMTDKNIKIVESVLMRLGGKIPSRTYPTHLPTKTADR